MLSADLFGRHAIVTGASSGLGRHFVEVLARSGAKVTLAPRRLDAIEVVHPAIIAVTASLFLPPLELYGVSIWFYILAIRRPSARGYALMVKMPLLFTPLLIAGATLRNRVVLSPMCQYCAIGGYAGDWHLVHLGKFALGGMGLVFTEATAVEERGRISYGDLGIWSDSFLPGLKRIAEAITRTII